MNSLADIAWIELCVGFVLGAAVATGIIALYRRRIVRYFTERELHATRRLIAEGRTDEAAARVRRLIREGLLSDHAPGIARRQVDAIYRESGAHETVTRVRSFVETWRSEHAEVEPGDVKGRVDAVLRSLQVLTIEEEEAGEGARRRLPRVPLPPRIRKRRDQDSE